MVLIRCDFPIVNFNSNGIINLMIDLEVVTVIPSGYDKKEPYAAWVIIYES